MDRDSALALLDSQHEFPGEFEFRVVVPPNKKELTVSAIAAAAGGRVLHVGERFSRTKKYVALQVRIHVGSAERVLEVYEVIKSLDYVYASL